MKRIDLQRLQPTFSKLIKNYLVRHKISQGQLAIFVGIGRNHLNPLINGSPNRRLSAYYINHFISRGVFTVDQIFDGHPESDRETEFWEKMKVAENNELVEDILFLKENGIDIADEIKIRAANSRKQKL